MSTTPATTSFTSFLHRVLAPGRTPSIRRQPARLALQALEVRDCPAANLVLNPSVEVAASALAPLSWAHSSAGEKAATFTYADTGLDGGRSVRIDATRRLSGDAEWYFDDVPVTPGQKYTFSDLYRSDVATTVSARFRLQDGTYSTTGQVTVPKNTTAAAFSADFTAPPNAVSATVFHAISRKGYLVTDRFSWAAAVAPDTTAPAVTVAAPTGTLSGTVTLVAQAADDVGVAGVRFLIDGAPVVGELTAPPYQYALNTAALVNGTHTVAAVARDAAGNSATSAAASFVVLNSVTPPPAPAATGRITLTFDDGWASQLQNAVPILQQAHLPASFYVITRANQGGQAWEEVQNPSLESAVNGEPVGWSKAQTGDNASTFTYAGAGTSHSARVDVTSYASGGAGWYFQDVQVTPGSQYALSHEYNSDSPTVSTVRFTLHDGTYKFQSVSLPATNGQWLTSALTVAAPVNADAMTIWHTIGQVGTLTVDNYSVKPVDPYSNPSYLTPAQIQGLQAAGYEVGDHTMTHADLSTLSAAGVRAEVDGGRADLLSLGITPKTFVYPYGSYTAAVQQAVRADGFIGARSVQEGLNTTSTDPYALLHHEVDVGTTAAQVQAWIAEAQLTKTWLILTFHEIDTFGRQYSTTPQTFQHIVNLVTASSLTPVTMAGGLLTPG